LCNNACIFIKPHLHKTDILLSVGRVYHDVEAVLLERYGDLGSVFVKLVDTEVVFKSGDFVTFHHKLPPSIELI